MIIVGITGGIGYGKSTFAEFLAAHAKSSRHWESSDIVAEVANVLRHESPEHPEPDNIAAINSWLAPLADIITTCVHCPADFTQIALTNERLKGHPENFVKLFEYLQAMQRNPDLTKFDITPNNKRSFRALLQWLGGYLVKTVNDGVWYDEIVRRIHQTAKQGLDLATVGGVRFPGDAERLRNAGGFIVQIERPSAKEPDKEDLTERERNLIVPDTIVLNNGTLPQLKHCSALVYTDLKTRSLQLRYQAAA